MSVHFLFLILYKLKSSSSLFCNECTKFKNTRARMLNTFYHWSLKVLFLARNVKICHLLCNDLMNVIT